MNEVITEILSKKITKTEGDCQTISSDFITRSSFWQAIYHLARVSFNIMAGKTILNQGVNWKKNTVIAPCLSVCRTLNQHGTSLAVMSTTQ